MFNGPIIGDPLDELDRVITPRSGTFRTSSASIAHCSGKIRSLIERNSSGLGYTIAFLVLASVGYLRLNEEEKQKDNPVTTAFYRDPLNGFNM